MTNLRRLATMIATGIKSDSKFLTDLWYLEVKKNRIPVVGFVSASTGKLTATDDEVIDVHIAGLKLERSVESCLVEAKRRTVGYHYALKER